jgi:hypothetical protein
MAMKETANISRACASHNGGNLLTKHPTTLRFAVASFDSWGGVRNALERIGVDDHESVAASCVGLQCVFTDTAASTLLPAAAIQELPFPGNFELICCTAGVLAQRLAERQRAGAPTLMAALSHWLIPRHAAELQQAVEQRQIVLWIQLFDIDDEHRAYRSLLAGSSLSVGVHDLVAE